MFDWQVIDQAITQVTRQKFFANNRKSVGGGSINQACLIHDGERSFFVKLNKAHSVDMFDAEVAGLAELASADAIRVPEVITHGESGHYCYLVLENLHLGGRGSAALLGQQMALLHQHTHSQFGWYRDNTIGSTPQINSRQDDWINFYRERRIAFQLQLAERSGYGGSLQKTGERLLEKMPALFEGYVPVASLLHGDLWSGNAAYTQDGVPVIYDPAVYYGDREADIAMTELFGGFGAEFYQAYNEAYPLHEGYKIRKELYNLYHILNHLNLFGGGYLSQAESMMQRLLSKIS